MHNKKDNTFFLFESLLCLAERYKYEGNSDKYRAIGRVLESFFLKEETITRRELELYKDLSSRKNLSEEEVKSLLETYRIGVQSLDPKLVRKTKERLKTAINKESLQECYNVFVPNYKTLASLHQFVHNKLLLESNSEKFVSAIYEGISCQVEPSKFLENRMRKGFGTKYKSLDPKMKRLLESYVENTTSDSEVKMILSEEVDEILSRIKKAESHSRPPEETELLKEMREFSEKDSETIESMIFSIAKKRKILEKLGA